MNNLNAVNIDRSDFYRANSQIAQVNAASALKPKTEEKAHLSEEISRAIANLNDSVAALRKEERYFVVDEDLEKIVVKILNSDTKELLRQIPTEEALKLSKRLHEMLEMMIV